MMMIVVVFVFAWHTDFDVFVLFWFRMNEYFIVLFYFLKQFYFLSCEVYLFFAKLRGNAMKWRYFRTGLVFIFLDFVVLITPFWRWNEQLFFFLDYLNLLTTEMRKVIFKWLNLLFPFYMNDKVNIHSRTSVLAISKFLYI